MTGNSLESIVEKMRLRSITEKWGAVCAFDRERLNRLLQQQWLDKYDGTTYVPVFSGKMDLNSSKTEYGVMQNIHLGKPLLSFEPSTLDNSRALLTLSILGGTFTAYETTHGVLYSYTITEAQGYTLKIKLDLSLVVGEVDRLGRVTLDLSKGIEFICDLAGPVVSQQKIGQFFADRFKALPRERQVYELGMLNLNGGGDLTPTNFIILTQRAPGADQPGAENVADGAVVVMIKLRGNAMSGDYPSKDTFPYLIPDDMENGVRKYSATMVLAKEFIERSDEEKLGLIRSVLFPGEKNVFVEHQRRQPYDMAIFGSLDLSKTSLTIEPAVHSLKAGGKPFTYKALLNNLPVNGVTWTVRSLNTNGSSGTIDSQTGEYTPVSTALISKQSVRNIVTASYIDSNRQAHKVSALLLVTTEAMSLSPGCVPSRAGGDKVTFVATALSGSTLSWTPPEYGTLMATGNTAVYTPPPDPESLPENFVVQPIEVKDGSGETARASVVLSKYAANMTIEPPFVSNLNRSATVTLKGISEFEPPEYEWRWEVIGEGEVSEGKFTAPATSKNSFSVVTCGIYYGNRLVRTGYSIIQLANFTPEPQMGDISEFHLVTLGSDKFYANGYQQIALEARIKTDGRALTPEEEASLRLVYVDSDQAVADVPEGQEGIPHDPLYPVLWSQTRIQNRFRRPIGRLDSDPVVTGQSNVPLFVVSRGTQAKRFYAAFVDELDNTFRSDVESGPEKGIITLLPMQSPVIDMSDYTFKRRRIAGGGTGSEDNNDDFDNWLETTDYWDLSYKREGQVALKFAALEFQGVFGVTPTRTAYVSTVKWESTHHNEKMFTYTGFAFNDSRFIGDERKMQYDSVLQENKVLKGKLDFSLVGANLPEGNFLIGVFRRIDVRQENHPDYPGNPDYTGNPDLYPLKEGLKLILTDNEGHRHPLEVKFTTDRNRPLLLSLEE